jgi:aromatic-L-amino-acid/L-tryptophan decarboxylase
MLEELQEAIAKIEADIANGPIVPVVNAQEIRNHLARYDFRTPIALDEACADVEWMLRNWNVQVTHPRYLGLFNPSVTPPSIVADTLVAMYNPQLASWRTSPAANEIERHTLAWLMRKFGLPENSSVSFTTGGSEGNLSAAIVALTRAFPEYGEQGLRHLASTPALYVTGGTHLSFNKIAHMAGLGRRAVRTVATDRDGKMDLEDLRRQVAQDRKNGLAPFMVVGTGGSTAAGVIDPLADLADFCRSEDLWFHVDAAWGGAAILSPGLREYLAGIEAADSITCDAHKWFSVPMGAGMFFCRHPDSVAATFHAENSFMPEKPLGQGTDPYTTSAQWSRRFIGLKLFLALAHYGECGYVKMIDHQTHLGNVLRKSLERTGWRIVNRTPLPLVCFTRDGLDAAAFLAALYERQIAWISQVQLNGDAPVLRACITSFRTAESDIQWVVEEMNRLI